MFASDFLMAAGVAVITGLDRTAAFQVMICRPIVAAPLTGWLLGDSLVGLQVGILVELLWLGRVPIGAAIPPDDTQVAVGATFLALSLGRLLGLSGAPFTILCLLVAIPIGQIGQLFDRLARQWNGRLLAKTSARVWQDPMAGVEQLHLRGLGHFAAASLATFFVIAAGGALLLAAIAPMAIAPVAASADRLRLLFPLVGIAVLLGTMNVRRSVSLFGISFTTALLVLWLV